MERILASATFKGSKRCSLFLRCVSRLAFEDGHEPLKERILGIEIFGRAPGYDTNEDPVVRNTAGDVRKRLAQYYQKPGHDGEVRVDLPVGSYLPQFSAPALSPHAPAAVPAPKRRLKLVWWAWTTAAACILAIAGLAMPFWHQNALDAFWAPVVKTPGSVLICIGQPVAFNFAAPIEAAMDQNVSSPNWFAGHGDETVLVRDILPFRTRYVTLLDAIALARITSVLNTNSKPFHIRGGGSTSFSDLRDNATVLIGAFTNDWTLKVGGKARYYFYRDEETRREGIRDRQNPGNRGWSVARPWPEWNVSEDYAIVSRVFAQDTGRVVVTAAGVTQFGTSAAGEFVTNPAYLQEALGQAPSGWEKRNLQVVLSTRVVENIAGPPRVLAVHFW
ncbi:MAG: hypothetical protein ACM336_07755 [Acidobacteriota bacterium]